MKNRSEKEIKREIAEELNDCNPNVWGKLCKLKQTKLGYQRIEEATIRMIGDTDMPTGSALALIESELEHQID